MSEKEIRQIFINYDVITALTQATKEIEDFIKYVLNLQQENKRLEVIYNISSNILNSAEKKLDKATEFVEDYKNQFQGDEVEKDMKDLLSILQGKEVN